MDGTKTKKRMNKGKLFYLFITLIICSCNFKLEKVDLPVEISKTKARSKELGLFLGEYNPCQVKINDTIKFEIIEAWVEYNFYYSDVEEGWETKKNWKLKNNFKPINGAHVTIRMKSDLTKKYKGLDNQRESNPTKNWMFDYYMITEPDLFAKDVSTCMESYGPTDYINLPDSIEVELTQYIPSVDTTKYGNYIELGRFYLTKK